ncbi:MAG: hypothetical protein OCC46_10630 [Pseudodesulfovibrio sp.]
MAKDFREFVVEASRHEQFGRWFKEVQVGMKVVISFQASDTHACEPAEILDDIYGYTQWEVSLRQTNKGIDAPKVGAWTFLKNNVWAKKFDKPEFQRCMAGEFIPVKEAQQVFEDVIDYAMKNDQMKSEDEIRIVEPDEEFKTKAAASGGGCGGGGCGGGKKPAKKPAKKTQ